MTTGEPEFLNDPQPNDPVPETPGAEPRPGHHSHAETAAVVGWLLAAGLAVAAPFLPVYARELPRRYGDYSPATGASAAGGPNGWGHPIGVDFGIPLVVCAGVFVVLAGLTVVRLDRLRRGRPTPGVALGRLAVAGPCLLAGVVAVLALYASAATGPADFGWSAYAPLNDTSAPYSSTLTITGGSSPGWSLWLAVAALACGAAATTVHLVAERTPHQPIG